MVTARNIENFLYGIGSIQDASIEWKLININCRFAIN